jgi:hypothetical protein
MATKRAFKVFYIFASNLGKSNLVPKIVLKKMYSLGLTCTATICIITLVKAYLNNPHICCTCMLLHMLFICTHK